MRPGALFTNFLWTASPANALVHQVPDAITETYPYKLGKARIRKVGESPYKQSFTQMSFAPRTLA